MVLLNHVKFIKLTYFCADFYKKKIKIMKNQSRNLRFFSYSSFKLPPFKQLLSWVQGKSTSPSVLSRIGRLINRQIMMYE